MRMYQGYRPPAWAEGIIRLIQYYGTRVKDIWMAALGDIHKLSMIFKKDKLNFWRKMFEEYGVLL